MAKLNIGAVISNLAQTASGMMGGQIAAEQELRKRKLEQQEQQRAYGQRLLSFAPQLDPDSQRQVMNFVAGMEGAFASGQPFQFQPQPMSPTSATPGVSPMQPGAFSPISEAMMPSSSGAVPAPPAAQPALRQSLSPERSAMFGFAAPGQGLGRLAPMAGAGVAQPLAAAPHQIAVMPSAGAQPTLYQQPAAAPVPAAPSGRSFEAPGVGRLTMRGVDPKEAQRLVKEIGDTWNRVNSQAFVKDPNTQAALRSYLAKKPNKPVGQWDETDFAQAQEALQGLNDTAAFLSRGNAQFQSGMDQAEVKQIETDLGKLSGYRADNLMQELIRLKGRARGLMERGMVQLPSQLMANLDDIDLMEQALAAGDKQQAGLILGLVRQELTPKPKEKEPYKALDTLLGQATRWAGVTPAAQQVYIRRLRQAAQDAGMDPSAIPDQIDALMSEETKARLGISKAQLGLAQKRETRMASEQAWRRGFDTRREARQKRKDEQERAVKDGDLTEQEQSQIVQWRNQRNGLERRLVELKSRLFTDFPGGGENPAKKVAADLEKQIDGLDARIQGIIDRKRPKAGAGGKAGGKAETGAMMNQLADPNRPENRKAAGAGQPKRKLFLPNDARIKLKDMRYRAYKAEGHSDAEARKMAEEDVAGVGPNR